MRAFIMPAMAAQNRSPRRAERVRPRPAWGHPGRISMGGSSRAQPAQPIIEPDEPIMGRLCFGLAPSVRRPIEAAPRPRATICARVALPTARSAMSREPRRDRARPSARRSPLRRRSRERLRQRGAHGPGSPLSRNRTEPHRATPRRPVSPAPFTHLKKKPARP
jgi:hypothetical protein